MSNDLGGGEEPPFGGKLQINTNFGPLVIGLWSKECPNACRNFIQLAIEGYYDGSDLFRIVPDFCIQGGDPKGDGGQSSVGGPIAMETHPRLRWRHRGLLGMVQGDHGFASQFFFTLSEAEDLYRKATCFACIQGDSIYTLMRMAELPATGEKFDCPPIVESILIIDNPFDDIIVRDAGRKTLQTLRAENDRVKKDISINPKKLSFQPPKPSAINKRKTIHPEAKETAKPSEPEIQSVASKHHQSQTTSLLPSQQNAKTLKSLKSQISKLKSSLRRPSTANTSLPTNMAPPSKSKMAKGRVESLAKLVGSKKVVEKVITDGRNSTRMDTLLALDQFCRKLKKENSSSTILAKDRSVDEEIIPESSLDICRLHGLVDCKSCRDTFAVGLVGDDDDDDETVERRNESWLMHRLKFNKNLGGYRDLEKK